MVLERQKEALKTFSMFGPGQQNLTAGHNMVQRCQDSQQMYFFCPSLNSLHLPWRPERDQGIFCEGMEM